VIRRAGAIVLAVATALAGACGFAEKKELADRIRSAPARVEAARTLRGGVIVEPHVVRPITAAGFGRELTTAAAVLDVNFSRRTATGSVPSGPDRQLAVFQIVSGPIVYQRRVGAAATSDGRAWRKLDLRDLYDDREDLRASAYGQNALSPLALIDLLRGALTGSVRRVGEEDLDGVRATHYRVNFAFDKAFDDAPDDLREGVEAGLAVMGSAYDGVSKGEVWLDAKGLPRRIIVTVRASRGREQAIDFRFRLDLFGFGLGTAIHLPRQKEIARVNSLSDLTEEAR
jgi:hypothetical protein